MDNSTGNYQIWTVPIELSSVNVDDHENNLLNSFYLKQNYPNPFNPITKIKYSIANSGFVSLIVYDVLGNQVATLENKVKPVGSYDINWNAENLTSGVYFYGMKAGDYVNIKKMVLLR